MMIVITLLPLTFLLMSYFLPDGTPPFRTRWLILMYALVIVSVALNVLTLWPHADPTGDAVTAAKESMRQAYQNVTLSLFGIAISATAFAIFLLRCRRALA